MYYIYRHIRLDKNEPFYIGKGVIIDNAIGFKAKHKRAYSKSLRNKHWYNIVNKTDYKIEIMFYFKKECVVFNKEIELIKLYGRKDLGLGTLVNLTERGEGGSGRVASNLEKEKRSLFMKGRIISQRAREIASKVHKGKKISQREIDAMRLANSKIVLDTETGIFYLNTKEVADTFNINSGSLSNMLAGFRKNKTKFVRV